MRELTKGMLARSKAGHDTGKWYIIMDIDGDNLYLADGEIRTLNRMKKKNGCMSRYAIRYRNGSVNN